MTSQPPFPTSWTGALSATLVSSSAVWLIAFQQPIPGAAVLAAGLILAWLNDRHLARSLSVIATGLVILSVSSLAADLSDAGMLRFTLILGAAVIVPTLLARWWVAPEVIRFPFRTRRRWSLAQWWYLIAVVVIGYLLLPFYFLGSGAYRNWPPVTSSEEIWRLFIGVNAVGLWDELFFVCIVFALLRRHFGLWAANLLQTVIFVSFLWELGYREWGPVLTIPFALVQGWIFATTASLGYVVTVHLLFDAVVFMVLVHAHNPTLFDWFVTAPR